MLAVGKNAQPHGVARFAGPAQVPVKLSHMVSIGLDADPDPLLDLDDQVVGANVGPVCFSAHLGPINQSGRHQQINDAIDDLGFVGLLADRNVARPPMEVKQSLGRLPQFVFTGLAGALFSHFEQS